MVNGHSQSRLAQRAIRTVLEIVESEEHAYGHWREKRVVRRLSPSTQEYLMHA